MFLFSSIYSNLFDVVCVLNNFRWLQKQVLRMKMLNKSLIALILHVETTNTEPMQMCQFLLIFVF